MLMWLTEQPIKAQAKTSDSAIYNSTALLGFRIVSTPSLTAHLPLVLNNYSLGQIAFMSSRDGNDEIYIMNADGSGQTRLTDNPAYDAAPVWSPDGQRIAFYSTRDGNSEIYVMNADAGLSLKKIC